MTRNCFEENQVSVAAVVSELAVQQSVHQNYGFNLDDDATCEFMVVLSSDEEEEDACHKFDGSSCHHLDKTTTTDHHKEPQRPLEPKRPMEPSSDGRFASAGVVVWFVLAVLGGWWL